MREHRHVLGLGVAVATFLALTVLPGSPLPYRLIAEAVAPIMGPRRVAFVLNIALFLPIGAVAGWYRRPEGVLAAFALTVGVELVQYVVPGRHPDGFDLIANAAGATIGYAAAGTLRRYRSRDRWRHGMPSPWVDAGR